MATETHTCCKPDPAKTPLSLTHVARLGNPYTLCGRCTDGWTSVPLSKWSEIVSAGRHCYMCRQKLLAYLRAL